MVVGGPSFQNSSDLLHHFVGSIQMLIEVQAMCKTNMTTNKIDIPSTSKVLFRGL